MIDDYKDNKEMVLGELNDALNHIKSEDVDKLIDYLLKADKIFLIGVGRVLISLNAIAKRWAHLGIDVHLVGEITEPAITKNDLLIVGSGSGSSLIPVAIAKKAKDVGATVIHIGSNSKGTMSNYADFMLRIPVQTKLYFEDEIKSEQPMTSLFEQSLFVLGDIVSVMIIKRQNLDLKNLWQHHANLE